MTALAIEPNSEEWLRERKKHIGASDAAIVLGHSKWMTRRELALSKLNEEIENSDPNGYLHRGHVLESLVKGLYEEETGWAINDSPMYICKDYPFMSATPDGWVLPADENQTGILVECKTSNRYRKDDWFDDEGEQKVPTSYWIQVQHQMAVTGALEAEIAVLFAEEESLNIFTRILDNGGVLEDMIALCKNTESIEFRRNRVLRDEAFIEIMIREEQEFWDLISTGQIPDDYTTIQDTGVEDQATAEQEKLVAEIHRAYLNSKRWTNKLDELKNQLAQEFGDLSAIISPIGKITYKKPQKPKASTSYKQVAEDLAIACNSQHLLQQIIERNTTFSSTRSMRLPRAWSKEI